MDEELNKTSHMFRVLNNWMFIRNMGKSLLDSPIIDWSKTISVYGLSHMGSRLVEELENQGISVCFAVDRQYVLPLYDFPIFYYEDKLPYSDYLIVSAVHYYDSIKKDMKSKTNANIVSLESIIESVRERL